MQENSTNPPETNRVNVPLVIGAMIVSGLLRFVPFRPPNFAAIGALSLFAGARLPWYVAFFVPLMVMYFTDAILWHTFLFPPFNWYVYGSYAVTVAVGLLLQRTDSPWKILAAAGGTGLLFFIVTNFGVWFHSAGPGKCYENSLAGLISCYVAGIPFHQWTLISDLLFATAYFGIHAWATKPAVLPVKLTDTR